MQATAADANNEAFVRELAFGLLRDLCGFTAYADVYGDDRAFDVVCAMRAAVRRATWGQRAQVAKWLGDGVMGQPVNLASRVADRATGHQVLATADVAIAARGVAGARVLSPVSLAGIRGPVELYELLVEPILVGA